MRVAVVIPCYKVKAFVLDVIDSIGPEVERILAVDDCCPEGSADFIEKNVTDSRVRVLRNPVNKGVGGAVMTGYRAALEEGLDIVVKVDGDGQMDPSLIPLFISPIIAGEADYAKGNRFFSAGAVRSMPKVRLFGNAALSFMTKLSSGYWSIFDPTNGYTAIHVRALASIDLDAISERYFFETDMLIRLGDLRAVIIDIPMRAVYGDEVSGLHIRQIFHEFLTKHIKATIRRFTYLYVMRDFNIASLNLIIGSLLMVFGLIFGSIEWIISIHSGVPASTGTVMFAVLPIIAGLQMLLFFLGYDISAEPKRPVQKQAVLSALDPAVAKPDAPSEHTLRKNQI
ncbi:glycosyl transferase family 2 [Ruegeria sp. ANG-S4]|uniref:glycosyltransferase family 2 protein n=1 Tax=Ruegeria sp. ANG-S4 TaxID=1577904 RepID=UPI00057DA229|nr:glycosyltransferase family 2 protein [Ruegeria sp. ANG-S4]KIC45524.1 glycosyl transferase family 2 [Ruegeria sp. ANG-S4]